MIVVDASVLSEVLLDTSRSEVLRARLLDDPDHAAPQLVDAEVLAVIQRQHHLGVIDTTSANQAVDDLQRWPGERWSHTGLLHIAWDMRDNVRAYDALYVALASALGATLVTLDRRLARACVDRCRVEVPLQ